MSSDNQQVVTTSYVIDASGGYSIQHNSYIPTNSEIYVENALQIKVGVDNLNKKLGIVKDPLNETILEINYDISNNKYNTDELTLTAEDILYLVQADNIISMGSLSTLYNDFNYTVLEYFGAPYGFASLFSGEEHYNVNVGSVFDASAFVHLINGGTFNYAGSYT